MKKILAFSLFMSLGSLVFSQTNFNMIWCGVKEAGNMESVILTPECMNESPRFWAPELGEFKTLGFKMAIVSKDNKVVFTSLNGEFTEEMSRAFKSKTSGVALEFFDVILSANGENYLSDKVYKVKYKYSK